MKIITTDRLINKHVRKFRLLCWVSLFVVLTSCNGQNTPKVTSGVVAEQKRTVALGDTVKQLGNNIMVVYQDKKNTYWFGSWETGAYSYDGKTIINYTTKHGLPHNRVDEILEDKLGNIYFGTSDGICKYDGKQFTLLKGLTSNASEWQLMPDDLWFKSSQKPGYVCRYDGAVLHYLKLPKSELEPKFHFLYPNNTTLSPYDVYCIYKDTRGNMWFGTNPLGALRYNGKSFDWIGEEDVTELHYGPANGVRSIIEDKDGYFWFNSMYRYNIYGDSVKKAKFYNKETGIGALDGIAGSDLWEYLSIAKDDKGGMWIATYRDGIWHYDGRNISHYVVKDGAKAITVFYIYKDNLGNLWLGTHENGTYKFNGKTFERFKNFD